jgi:hypothetical protein
LKLVLQRSAYLHRSQRWRDKTKNSNLFSKFSDEPIADRALGGDPWNRKRSARFTEQALMRRGNVPLQRL